MDPTALLNLALANWDKFALLAVGYYVGTKHPSIAGWLKSLFTSQASKDVADLKAQLEELAKRLPPAA